MQESYRQAGRGDAFNKMNAWHWVGAVEVCRWCCWGQLESGREGETENEGGRHGSKARAAMVAEPGSMLQVSRHTRLKSMLSISAAACMKAGSRLPEEAAAAQSRHKHKAGIMVEGMLSVQVPKCPSQKVSVHQRNSNFFHMHKKHASSSYKRHGMEKVVSNKTQKAKGNTHKNAHNKVGKGE